MTNILELSHLKKYYATQKAVDDISFNINTGSIFGLLGPNGAGKTTLLRMITGIFYPDSGDITFDGKNSTRSMTLLRSDTCRKNADCIKNENRGTGFIPGTAERIK